MPAKRVPGIGRINIRCEGWFADRVDEAAKKTGRSLSSYVRIALAEQMRRDGVSPDGPAEPAKKRGRPRKEQ
jgi:hypothetical protein